MKFTNTSIVFLVVLLHLAAPGGATAGIASATVREVAEQLVSKGGREVAGESAESIARELGSVAKKYGPSGVEAARKGGPTVFRYLAEGGENAPKVVKLFEKHGDRAIHIVSRPKSIAIFLKHGDDAATAMIRHPGIAEDLITPFGASAARALSTLSAQNGRRLAMLAEDGLLTKTGRSAELLNVIARYGDKAMEFIWKNKGALTVGATLVAFLAKPEAFINGAADITKAVAVPLAEKAGDAAVELARNSSGTVLGIVFGTGTLVLLALWISRKRPSIR